MNLGNKLFTYLLNWHELQARASGGENKPTTRVLSELADVLEITTDFLMNGSTDEAAEENLADKELLSLFKKINTLSGEKKDVIKEFLNAFVLQAELKSKLAH